MKKVTGVNGVHFPAAIFKVCRPQGIMIHEDKIFDLTAGVYFDFCSKYEKMQESPVSSSNFLASGSLLTHRLFFARAARQIQQQNRTCLVSLSSVFSRNVASYLMCWHLRYVPVVVPGTELLTIHASSINTKL